MAGLERFLYSRKNLVGSALAVAGLALHFVGLLGGPLWLPLVIGLYLVGVLLTPAEPRIELSFAATADATEVREGLAQLVRSIKGKVAQDILERVESIRASILVTLEADQGRVAGDPNVRLIRQTALDYLPAALAAYRTLPRAYAERRPVADGRTPHAVLLEQLDLMDAKMREAADAILAHDSEKLLANGRFLADRFAVTSLDIRQGAGATPGPGPGPGPAAPASGAREATPVPVPPPPPTARQVQEAEAVAERERVR